MSGAPTPIENVSDTARWVALYRAMESEVAGERTRCVLESRAVDLTDGPARRALFAEVAGVASRVVVMTEGLLIYLADDEVASLARDLHAQPSFRWWLTDLGSPQLLQFLERTWAPSLRAGNAPLRFAPAEGTRFFAPHGWKEAEHRSMWHESHRLRRTVPMAWLLRLVERFASARRREEWRRFSAVVMLERASAILPASID